MASLRLTFPEKEEPTVIALSGARLTIGRLPFNTIQIIDRTVSGFHAELINEHGHYRLHDRGSSNGTFVNGQKVADYHLNEACTIMFGTVEVQFSPETVDAGQEAENFPTRSEINAVRKENAELKATVEALREETTALRQVRPLENGDPALAVTRDEFEKVVVEREALKEERLKQETEVNRLKTDLAVLKRDRVNLQLAFDTLQREISELRVKAGGGEEIALPPKAAAATLAAQSSAPREEVRVDVPAAPAAPTPAPVAAVPAPALAPKPAPAPSPVPARTGPAPGASIKPFAPLPKITAAASEPPAETKAPRPAPEPKPAPAPAGKTPEAPAPSAPLKPFAPLPKAPAAATEPPAETRTPAPAPTAPQPVSPPAAKPSAPAPSESPTSPGAPGKPFSPLPKAPAVAATVLAKPIIAGPSVGVKPTGPGAPMKAPAGLGSGVRALARPPIAAAAPAEGGSAGALQNAPTARLIQRPQPSVNLPAQPTVKLPAVPAEKVGPKGTQKLA